LLCETEPLGAGAVQTIHCCCCGAAVAVLLAAGVGADIVDWVGVMNAPPQQLEAALHGRSVCTLPEGVGVVGLREERLAAAIMKSK